MNSKIEKEKKQFGTFFKRIISCTCCYTPSKLYIVSHLKTLFKAQGIHGILLEFYGKSVQSMIFMI